MTRYIYSVPAALAAILIAVAMAGSAAAASGPSAADMQAVQNFKLTPAFLHNYQAYQEEAAQKPCELSPIFAFQKAGSKSQSLDETAAAFDAQPGVRDALKRNGLTARELLVGMMTLMSAAAQDIAAQHPDLAKRGGIKSKVAVSPENMTFYRQHKDEFHRHQMQLAREQLKRNGGQLPACLKSKE